MSRLLDLNKSGDKQGIVVDNWLELGISWGLLKDK
jgi:hypothetical protein